MSLIKAYSLNLSLIQKTPQPSNPVARSGRKTLVVQTQNIIFVIYTMTRSCPVGDNYATDKSGELYKSYLKVADEKQRLLMLRTLHKRGICTRDVLSFIVNQAELRSVDKKLDKPLARVAMKSKVHDANLSLRLNINRRQ